MAKTRDHLRDAIACRADMRLRRPPRARWPAALAIGSDPLVAGAGGGAGIALPQALLITDVRSFAETLREAVAQGDVTLDASRLKDIDTAGLQLLCATRAAALAAGRPFRWAAASDGLRAAALAVGLQGPLGLAA